MINLSATTATGVAQSSDSLQFVDVPKSLQTDATAATAASIDPDAREQEPGTVVDSLTPSFLKTARHPLVCLFHLLFKILALITFIFGSFVFGGWEGDYVFTFVVTTILLSVDFWTVKNISGRILVGMRWWNNINDDGTSSWFFESQTDERNVNTTDKTVFWTATYLWPLTWLVFFLLYLIRLQIEWVLLVAIALVLSVANLVGYWKCSKEAKRRMKEWASTAAVRTILGRFGV